MWAHWQFELLVPMAGDQCHYYWCLDYRAGGPQAEPRVSYIDVECLHDAEIAISLTALVQRFSAEVARSPRFSLSLHGPVLS